MARIDESKAYKVVYAVCKHEYLGYLIEPHMVQLNADGDFSLTHQRLFSNTAKDYLPALDATDLKLIAVLEEIEQSYIIKRHSEKQLLPSEFFKKAFNENVYAQVRPFIEKKIAQVLPLLKHKDVYLMGKEGWPIGRKLHIADEPASACFYFRCNDQETRYFPIIQHQNKRVEFMYKNAQIISNQPAILLLNDILYHFDNLAEGKKLHPFLNKRYIAIPKSTEESYFHKFVAPLIEKCQVRADGFQIITERYQGQPVLKTTLAIEGALQLCFQYGAYTFTGGDEKTVSVQVEKKAQTYTFHRIKRSISWENNRFLELKAMGLKSNGNSFLSLEHMDNEYPPPSSIIYWLNENYEDLKKKGYRIEQAEGGKKFLFGKAKIDISIKEHNDWFDLHALVHFGPYQIPFIQLKPYILKKVNEFILPSGEVAIIPQQWFSQYSELLYFSEGINTLKLKKHHLGLINELENHQLTNTDVKDKLQRISHLYKIEEAALPEHFNGSLRPYQKAGYNWFHFLHEYGFGGCLADDMGLGKTVQTLALLQKMKEKASISEKPPTSLIIMPTSLIYNWQQEAAKFAPSLTLLAHVGSSRTKEMELLTNYDVVLTTYGTIRIDANHFQQLSFNYIILDESQNIKNATSKAFLAIKSLKAKHKLALSGTLIENSVSDLWTQMSFVNPGLLGSLHIFQNEYAYPIEKKKDYEKARRLQTLINPFILRRTKDQVATELPPKTEQLFYCEMSHEQASYYEKIKSECRNSLLESIEAGTFHKSARMQILQGLTKLRQIANHPQIVDDSYQHSSGKFENVVNTLGSVLSCGHKVLMFSQFVRHLAIYRDYLDQQQIRYAYLDGTTKNRGEIVKAFEEKSTTKLFLISIKAGGVGFNLTSADYVFLLDPWWNPAVEQQAIDRTHRIGQTKNVFIYKFIAKNTVEEKILALQNRKKMVAETLITTEEGFEKHFSITDLKEILD